jgi:hypothetical protein
MDIYNAFERAEREESKLPKEFIEKLNGLSSPKVWHLLNNLAAQSETYLEIGSFMGSSLLAAIHNNTVKATAVDNFCMKPKVRGHFFYNTKGYTFDFIEEDCFKLDPSKLGPFDLYFFDGEHTYSAQYNAITYFLPAMKDEFTYIVDDWNNEPVRNGTFDAIKDSGLKVEDFVQRKNNLMKDKAGWWCGTACFKLKKS